jgi:hypothetical protein
LNGGLHRSTIVVESAVASRRAWPQDRLAVPRFSPTVAGWGGKRRAASSVRLRGSRY